ncbi:helix-turn-helix domain-containing protein [Lactiplantibacillus nangangensis]|uniref:Helix-turn-helix domain-containing protein n=1 Tax=Lactiplantibacillus nangangensis TaxID=2559917 RepID=A0ABW1SKV0_9LACO|nr:helix-turn-helix transcriptional regulator [Lactiplantibacillus nangangensis]
MFLGNVIFDERKKQGLTQTELAAGICNQNIISRLEKHDAMPTLPVLLQLCLKLNLTLNDVFSDFASNANAEEHAVLVNLERDILLGQVDNAAAKLALITEKQLKTNDQISYTFLKGFLAIQSDPDTALFMMDKVLMLTQNDTYDVYTELAYLVKAKVYMAKQDLYRAGDYYGLIMQALQANLLISNAKSSELLFILKDIAAFYFASKDQVATIKVSNRGIKLAQTKHVTYFVEYLYYYKVSCLSATDSDFETQCQMGIAMATANENNHIRQLMKSLLP